MRSVLRRQLRRVCKSENGLGIPDRQTANRMVRQVRFPLLLRLRTYAGRRARSAKCQEQTCAGLQDSPCHFVSADFNPGRTTSVNSLKSLVSLSRPCTHNFGCAQPGGLDAQLVHGSKRQPRRHCCLASRRGSCTRGRREVAAAPLATLAKIFQDWMSSERRTGELTVY